MKISPQGIMSSEKGVTPLGYVLLKERNLGLAPRQGAEFSSRACLWVSPRPCHYIQCWLTNQRLILLHTYCLETPKSDSSLTNFRKEPSLESPSGISLPRNPACPGTQYSPTAYRVEISLNDFWHCWTSRDGVLTA